MELCCDGCLCVVVGLFGCFELGEVVMGIVDLLFVCVWFLVCGFIVLLVFVDLLLGSVV